jgi:prevent-host-death family protein
MGMGSTMVKPTLSVDQLTTSSDAQKKFGDLSKRAKEQPQYITMNGNVDTVLISYELYERMYDRLTQLEQEKEERTLLQRIERNEQHPASARPWKAVRRDR